MTAASESMRPETADIHALGLPALREYRQRLEAEEDRVSYWRRLVHARLDLLAAESASDHALTLTDLVRVLGDTGTGQTRQALVSVRAGEPLPELPELTEMWATDVDPHVQRNTGAVIVVVAPHALHVMLAGMWLMLSSAPSRPVPETTTSQQ